VHTLGSWASKTAGTFIRSDEVPATFRALLDPRSALRAAIGRVAASLGMPDADDGLLAMLGKVLSDNSAYIMVGNRQVFDELAGCCSAFLVALGDDKAYDAARLATFCQRFSAGPPEPDAVHFDAGGVLVGEARGGQDLLRAMVESLYAAMFETDRKRRAEQILYANACGGLHEQTRLQTYIAGGLDAPIVDTLGKLAHDHVEKDAADAQKGPLHAAVDHALTPLLSVIEHAWREFCTASMMTLTLPDVVLHLGNPEPPEAGQPLFPPDLQHIQDPKLAATLAKYGALEVTADDSLAHRLKVRVNAIVGWPPIGEEDAVEATDWASLDQRMKYILTLFRIRQQDEHLFQQPFSAGQRALLLAGELPPGQL
jgi:hypothetical protein